MHPPLLHPPRDIHPTFFPQVISIVETISTEGNRYHLDIKPDNVVRFSNTLKAML